MNNAKNQPTGLPSPSLPNVIHPLKACFPDDDGIAIEHRLLTQDDSEVYISDYLFQDGLLPLATKPAYYECTKECLATGVVGSCITQKGTLERSTFTHLLATRFSSGVHLLSSGAPAMLDLVVSLGEVTTNKIVEGDNQYLSAFKHFALFEVELELRKSTRAFTGEVVTFFHLFTHDGENSRIHTHNIMIQN